MTDTPKERRYHYPLAALTAFEEATKLPILGFVTDAPEYKTVETNVHLIWAGQLKERPDLAVEQVKAELDAAQDYLIQAAAARVALQRSLTGQLTVESDGNAKKKSLSD